MDASYYKEKYEPIDGKWHITKKLGSGAFGTVLEIERRDQTNMKAAIKIVSVPSSAGEVESYREENYDLDEQSISSYFFGFVEEFTKEIQIMSELRGHGNIVTIEDYDVKKHTDEIGWDIFIRMELLTPMNKFYRENPPKTRDVIRLGIDICKALEACQKYKITHRDIKPSNIFISKNGDYKLGDFGISRTLEKTSSGLSKKGTYTYMAPEVFKGEAYGSNVDIYSLGIVMYKILNNNLEPFRKDRTHLDEENALALRLKGESIPNPANAEGRLAEIVLKACSFNPKDRYESPSQMRSELEAILYGENEEKIILGASDTLDLELLTNSTVDSQKRVEINTEQSVAGEKTVSVFGNVGGIAPETDEDKTVGIFDKKYEKKPVTVKNKKLQDQILLNNPSGIKKCPKCGKEQAPNRTKCWECGYNFEEIKPIFVDEEHKKEQIKNVSIKNNSNGATKECPNCGKPQATNRSRCWDCGYFFDEVVPIFVDEEHKGKKTSGSSSSKSSLLKQYDEPISLFRNIDDYDDELKKKREPVRQTELNPATKKYLVATDDSGGAFRRMDENYEELIRMRKEEGRKKKGLFDFLMYNKEM